MSLGNKSVLLHKAYEILYIDMYNHTLRVLYIRWSVSVALSTIKWVSMSVHAGSD